MKTGAKVFLWVLGIIVVLAAVFVGLYIGLLSFLLLTRLKKAKLQQKQWLNYLCEFN